LQRICKSIIQTSKNGNTAGLREVIIKHINTATKKKYKKTEKRERIIDPEK
jgi:hypothetical protein